MSNFSPKLEEATDEQLRHGINEHNPHYAQVESDELTRRSLSKLQRTIEVFNKKSSKQTNIIIGLTIALFIVAIVQIYFGIDYKRQCASFGGDKWECTTWTDYGFLFGTKVKTERNFKE